MKKLFLVFYCSMLVILLSCGGPSLNTLTIQTPFSPQPDVLLYHKNTSTLEDLTTQITQPITKTLAMGESACIFALYGSTGTYNVGTVTTQPPMVGVPPTPLTYNINPANTYSIPFSYTSSPSVQFLSGMVAPTKKDMEMKFAGHIIKSWGNLPATGPFASTPLPTPEITNSFTVKDNIDNNKILRYIDRVGINVSSGNQISISMKTLDMINAGCLGLMNNYLYTIGEVQIAYQKFGTPKSPYQLIPSSLVQVTAAGELVATINLPQANTPYLNSTNPAPGLYYIRLILTDASRRFTVVSEISPAFVVWNL